jgi:ATP-dependent DNA ligase
VRDDNATWLVVLHSFPFIPPCEPTLRDRLPKGEGWLYEAKFDGYRLLIHKASRSVTLYTRNGQTSSARLPEPLGATSCSRREFKTHRSHKATLP